MSDSTEALALLRERANEGEFDALIADIESGKLGAGVLKITNEQGVHLLRANNFLGRFDEVLATAEKLLAEPVVYVFNR